MVNKALRIVLYTIFTISLLFVVPFNNIHADTLTTSQITYNVYLQDVVDSSNSTLVNKDYIYDIDFNFDKSYLGWVSVQMIISYTHATGDTRQLTINRALYLNGSNVHTSIVISSNFNGINGGPFLSMSISVNNSNVTPMADISSLQDVIDLLQDIDNHISIDVLGELENIVANTSLANTYLETLTKIRQWNIPLESYPLIEKLISENKQIVNVQSINYYNYPIFKINQNEIFLNYYLANSGYDAQLMLIAYVKSGYQNNIFQSNNIYNVSYANISGAINNGFILMRYVFTNISGSARSVNIVANIEVPEIIPIYVYRGNFLDILNISTDFALQFGLNNRLLNNIGIIANGTNASSAASSQSDQTNSQLQQDSNTLFTQEDSFKQNMNSAMQNIDTTFSLNNFGSSFMTSAQWVRTQYETLTNNTPFASLITFSLLVGLALIVIGKVYK